jgi:hypothetical protein
MVDFSREDLHHEKKPVKVTAAFTACSLLSEMRKEQLQ